MRIGVMATGAVGGYFGARLQQAGHEVVFIARGAHLDALRKDGLKIASPVGDLHLKKVTATDDPRTIGPVDIVLFAVKLWDTEKAGEQTKPLIGPDTAVITLQNGVDSVARLDPLLGTAHVVGGLTYIGSRIAGPGAIQHIGLADIRCGERDGKPSKRLLAFADAAKQAGFDFAISDNIELDLPWDLRQFPAPLRSRHNVCRTGFAKSRLRSGGCSGLGPNDGHDRVVHFDSEVRYRLVCGPRRFRGQRCVPLRWLPKFVRD